MGLIKADSHQPGITTKANLTLILTLTFILTLSLIEGSNLPLAGEAVFVRDFILYSDNQGANWTAGELLPSGWSECQVAEMKNGSLLLTSRLGKPYNDVSVLMKY